MADTPTLPTFTVTGVPIFGNPFDQDAPPEFIGGGLSLNEAAAASEAQYPGATPEPEEAFAPPVVPLPVKLLPEVVVEAPTIFGTLLTGITALLFPQPMGPREFDEAPGGGGAPPPPTAPVGEDPIMPPNWWDLVNEPFEITKPGPPITPIPLTPVEMPPGEKFFDVSPPKVTTPSIPFETWLTPIPAIEVPYEFPGEFPFPDALDTGPGPAPTPTSTPRVDPVPLNPVEFPFAQPIGVPQPGPTGAPAPDVLGDPFADPIGDPFGDPFPSPELPERPSGTPLAPDQPTFFADPTAIGDPLAFDAPLPEFGPAPQGPEKDQCSCAKKPKKKKKPSDRAVCYRGTYRQNKRGITYNRLEEIPCEAKAKKAISKRETDAFGRPVPKKRGGKRTPTWRDTVDEVFGRLI